MSSREWTNDWHGTFHNRLAQVDPMGPQTGLCKVVRRDGEDREAFPTNTRGGEWPLPEMSFHVVMVADQPANPYVSPPVFNQAAVKQSTSAAQQGPNPNVPYFTVRFALPLPPDNDDDGDFALMGGCPATVFHQHSPGFEIMPNGDALAVFFSAIDTDDEFADDVKFIQARLQYGSDMWEMPELFYDFKHMNEQSVLLWTKNGADVWFFGGGRIDDAERLPFKVAFSKDNGQPGNCGCLILKMSRTALRRSRARMLFATRAEIFTLPWTVTAAKASCGEARTMTQPGATRAAERTGVTLPWLWSTTIPKSSLSEARIRKSTITCRRPHPATGEEAGVTKRGRRSPNSEAISDLA